jgi:hypothetical protein
MSLCRTTGETEKSKERNSGGSFIFSFCFRSIYLLLDIIFTYTQYIRENIAITKKTDHEILTDLHVFSKLITTKKGFACMPSVYVFVLLHVHPLLGNGLVNKFPRKHIPGKESVVMSRNKRTNVYGSLLGNNQRANGLAR